MSRIYFIEGPPTEETLGDVYLVRATSVAAAIRHVTRDRYVGRVATQDDLIENRIPVQDATEK